MKMSAKIKFENQTNKQNQKFPRSIEYTLDDQNTFDETFKKVPLSSVVPLNIYNNLPG